MKICYIASLGSMHTERWIKYFANIGHEVHLITSGKFSTDYIKNVKIHTIKRFRPSRQIIGYLLNTIILVPNILKLRRLFDTIKPDIVHAHYINDVALCGAAGGFHPFVVTVWGSDVLITPKEFKVLRWIVKYVLKNADLITCDAEHIREPLIELRADPQKIKPIYFGTDTREFNPGQRDEKFWEKLGIFDSPIIISLRRLEPIYDIESLVTAVPLVLKKVTQATFVIGSTGSQEVKLRELAKSLGISDSVKFVGYIPDDELPRYMASADIYVSTSLSDAGLAASTAQAMACGLPVIITDFGDNRKWVEDGVNGFIIPLKSPEALASKIIYLLQNKNDRKNFGQINRRIIEEKNNWEKEMGKMCKLYEELIEKFKKTDKKRTF